MKVWIENAGKDPNTLGGKGLFCCRLAVALKQMGVDVTGDDSKRVDISLNPIRLKHQRSRVRVLRLDGIYHNSEQDYYRRNLGIQASLRACDAVVYQSEHARKLCDAFLGPASVDSIVIFNGSDCHYYACAEPDVESRQMYTFLAFGRWRPHKRLVDIIESFLLANIENSQLIIAGNHSQSGLTEAGIVSYGTSVHIKFLGHIDQPRLASLLLASRGTIHLCWFDACPNSVVESLCAGVPVISNNVGGTPELLRAVGLDRFICDIDHPYDYKPVRLYHPPPVNRSIVASKLHMLVTEGWTGFDNAPLRIGTIAHQYFEFFQGLL